MRNLVVICAISLSLITGAHVYAAEPMKQKSAQSSSLGLGTERFMKINISVADISKGLSFYSQVFGLQEKYRYEPGSGLVEVFMGYEGEPLSTSTAINLVYHGTSQPGPTGTGGASLALVVKDVRVAVAKANAAGGKVVREPTEFKDKESGASTVYAFIEDPFGNAIELAQVQ